MFFSCPHCRELVATDRQTRLPPVMCPRCGGVLREEPAVVAVAAPNGPSIASLLHGATAIPAVAETETDEIDAPVEATGEGESISDDIQDDASVAAEEERSSETIALATDEISTQAPEPATPSPVTEYLGPSFTRQRAQPSTPARTAKWQWALMALLAMTLGLQVLLADRDRLAADASWRPMVSSLCRIAGCSVPAWHQPGAFAMLSRDVSPIPGTVGGLNVQATFRNDAHWPQAWPVLLLSLSDADGRVLGSRAFSPKEYLGAAATQTELAPGQSAQIALKLHEPNPDVVAFSFDFR